MTKFLKRILGISLGTFQRLPLYKYIAKIFSNNIIIKEADNKDLRLFYSSFYKSKKNEKPINISTKDVTRFVAKKSNKIIGFVELVIRTKENTNLKSYWLYSLMVKPFYRGIGIGKLLTQAVIKEANNRRALALYLFVNKKNYKAIRLYSNLGFREKDNLSFEKLTNYKEGCLSSKHLIMEKNLEEQS